MPINAFGGAPGSGKTYGVMEHVILPAVANGRFVITNIEGLNEQSIYDHVADAFYKGKIFCIGHIRTCDRNAPESPAFFPGQESLDKPVPVPSPDTGTVTGGDLVVIDEATRYWSSDMTVSREHAYFFREHRHFSNEVGHTCDLVVIDPDLTLLARALKGKVEMASVTHKPKEIGLNGYVVNLYRGVRLRSKPFSTQGPYRFKKEIYKLYKSYSHENAKEQSVDGRQNVFKNPRLWLFATALLVTLIVCIVGLYSLYRRQVNKSSGPAQEVKSIVSTKAVTNAVVTPTVAAKSENLRVAGEVVLQGERWIVLMDQQGAIRFENPSAFVGKGAMIVGNIEGQRVATWTGLVAKPQSILGGAK